MKEKVGTSSRNYYPVMKPGFTITSWNQKGKAWSGSTRQETGQKLSVSRQSHVKSVLGW